MWTGCVLKSESAKQLVWVGRSATSRLLRALRDPEKNLVAHVVLTAIWEPEKISSARGWRSEYIWFSPKIRARRPSSCRGSMGAEGCGVSSDG